jgi:hypothetical protein
MDGIRIDFHVDDDTTIKAESAMTTYGTIDLTQGVGAYSGATLYFASSEHAAALAKAAREVKEHLEESGK